MPTSNSGGSKRITADSGGRRDLPVPAKEKQGGKNVRKLTIALSAVAIVISLVAVYGTFSDDGGSTRNPFLADEGCHAEVVYHAFYSDPSMISTYNEPTGYDGTQASTLSVTYSGESFCTEYNPQVWDHDGTWFAPVDGEYLVLRTCVFNGWKYSQNDTAHAPCETIELRDGVWYAGDLALAEYGSPIHIYASWAVVQQVAVDDEEFRDHDYLMIGNREYDITGKTSLTVPNQKTTKNVVIGTDDKGRKFVTTVHEKFPVQTDDVGSFVFVYGTRYDITEGSNTVYIDRYPCPILIDKDGSSYIESYYYLMNETDGTVNIRGETYRYTIRNEAEGTPYAYVEIFGDEDSLSKCPITTKKDPVTGETLKFLGYSRYYGISGSAYTNIRLVDSLTEVSDSIFDGCTVRGGSIDLGNDIIHIGPKGCFIDNVSFSGEGGILSDGNMLRVGPNVSEGGYDFVMAEGGAYDPIQVTSVFRDFLWSVGDFGGLSEDSLRVDSVGNVSAGTVAQGTASDNAYNVTMQAVDPDHRASASTVTVTVHVALQLVFSNTPEDGGLDSMNNEEEHTEGGAI